MTQPAPRLARLIGLDLLEENLPPEDIAHYYVALLEGTEQLLRGCGPECIPPLWWSAWSPLERRALADAGDRVRAEAALLFGLATQGKAGVTQVAARLDGGRSLVRAALDGLLDRMTKGGRP